MPFGELNQAHGICARMEYTVAVSAYIDAIIESIDISGRNVNRLVPKRPVANTLADREREHFGIPGAVITRVDVKCRIISLTAVGLVIVGTFGRAGPGECRASAFGVNGGIGVGFGDGVTITLGFGSGRDGSQFRSTFLDGRSENEACESGEGKKDVRETHSVVARW